MMVVAPMVVLTKTPVSVDEIMDILHRRRGAGSC